MAELGSISFTDVNQGVRPIDRTGPGDAAVQMGKIGVQIANEAIKANATGDMVDAIDDTQGELPPTVPDAPDATVSAIDSPEAELKTRIDRWKKVAEQGNTSQKTLAEMRIKEVLNDAQANYPWLAEDLQRRAGIVMSGNAELHELGLQDAANKSAAGRAQGQIDDIQTYATKKWEDGGLGISPDLEIGGPQWLAQYVELDTLRQEQQKMARVIGMTSARAESSAAEVEHVATLALQGKFSIARAGRHDIFSRHGFDTVLAEVQKGDGANLEMLAQFSQVAVPSIIDDLEGQKQDAIVLYETHFRGAMAGTAAGVRAKAQLDDFIQEQDAIINNFKASSENMPDAMKLISTYNSIRAADIVRGMSEPHRNFIAFVDGPGKNLIEVAKLAKTADGLVTANKLGVQAVGILQGQMPGFMGPDIPPESRQTLAFVTSGQGSITPEMSFRDVNGALDKYQRDANNPWFVTTGSDAADQEAAFWSLDNHIKLWNAALTVPDLATPEAAAQYLTGANNSIRAYLAAGTPSDVDSVIRTSLASPSLLSAIDTVGDNTNVVNQRRAFGASAKEWYEGTDPDQRRAEALHSYNTTTVSGVRLSELAQIDIDTMSSDGVFAYEINPTAFASAVRKAEEREEMLNRMDAADFGSMSVRSKVEIEEKLRNEIIEAMDPIAQEVNESITISSNLNHATAINAQTRRRSDVKLQYFDELGWLDGFSFVGERLADGQ